MVNKNHPKYPEYHVKCKKLLERQWKEVEPIKYTGGRSGPLGEIYKRHIVEIKALQNEYSYLFTEEEP